MKPAPLSEMLSKILSLFSHDIAIDLGTSNTLVFVAGKGVAIREPSVVAVRTKGRDILAVGAEAREMIGKTPAAITAVRPLRNGVISDFEATEQMLGYLIRRIHESPTGFPMIARPRVVVGIPSLVTEVERRAVSDAVRRAGAREVFLVQEPMAAAIGGGLPVEEPKGSMIVDIGGGTTEVAVISLGGIVVGRSLKVAGDELDQAVINFARAKYHIHLGERTAEALKIKVGEACKSRGKRRETMMRGRDLKTGLPKAVVVTSEEIGEALHGPLATIVASVKDILEDAPPELIPDILDQGITLAGGMSQLRGMAPRFSRELGAPVKIAEDPITCVVRGAGMLLENRKLLDKVKV